MASQHNDRLTKWHVDQTSQHQIVEVTKSSILSGFFFQKGPHYLGSYLTQHQVDKIVR